jgi:hypothetical protein
MNGVANRVDEQQIDQDLNKLEELVNEAASKSKTQTDGTKTA